MTTRTLNLRQSLPVVPVGDDLHIGLVEPHALCIEDAPAFLRSVLVAASTPTAPGDLEAVLLAEGCTPAEAAACVEELIAAGVLVDEWVPRDDRYSRHDLYYGLAYRGSGARSADLATCAVGILGVGGIGTNCALQLAAAGVGTLHLHDPDTVETSNLTRQYLFEEGDVGELKVEAARRRLRLRNSSAHVTTEAAEVRSAADLMGLFECSDVVIVSADTPQEVLLWANQAALQTGTPFMSAGYQDTLGVAGPLVLPRRSACLRCHLAHEDEACCESAGLVGDRNLNSAFQAPSFGPLNAIVAACAVTEALRLLLTDDSVLVGRRWVYDSVQHHVRLEPVERRSDCPACT